MSRQATRMKRHTVGDVDCSIEDERLILRYSQRFVRKAAAILGLMAVACAALLAYPLIEISRGNLVQSLTPVVFLMILGGAVGTAATVGWIHLGLFARKPIEFDRGAGVCSIPRWFRRPLAAPLNEIDHVLARRKRKARDTESGPGSAHFSDGYVEKTHILLVLRDGAKPEQIQLWGYLGLPNSTRADQVAEQIAEFLGCKLRLHPASFFR